MIAIVQLKAEYRELATPKGFDDFLNGQGVLGNRADLADQFAYDWHARKLTFEPHFRALLLQHATDYASARDLQWAAENDILFESHQADFEISVPGFARANAERPLEPFLVMLQQVMDAVAQLPYRRLQGINKETWEAIVDLLSQVDLFDATQLELPPSLADWAQTSNDEAGLKLQLKVDGLDGDFKQLMLTPPTGNDNPYFESLLDLEEGARRIYVFDAGYFEIGQYHTISSSDNFFVTKLHRNIKPQTVCERPAPAELVADDYTVLEDRYVTLTGAERWYRCLRIRLSTNQDITILTNLLWLSAEQICLLYRYRWKIEIIFRWLKSLLELDHWISHDPRGIIRQVLTALIVWGLLIIFKQDDQEFSPKQLWRELQAAIHQAIFEFGRSVGRAEAQVEPVPPR